jgi:hypothetical protein
MKDIADGQQAPPQQGAESPICPDDSDTTVLHVLATEIKSELELPNAMTPAEVLNAACGLIGFQLSKQEELLSMKRKFILIHSQLTEIEKGTEKGNRSRRRELTVKQMVTKISNALGLDEDNSPHEVLREAQRQLNLHISPGDMFFEKVRSILAQVS